jgi:hypothetical protein
MIYLAPSEAPSPVERAGSTRSSLFALLFSPLSPEHAKIKSKHLPYYVSTDTRAPPLNQHNQHDDEQNAGDDPD